MLVIIKSNIGNNDWSGQFTGKDGVYSVSDFLNNKQAQENAVREYAKKQWMYIKHYAIQYEGKMINGILITQSGMIAAAHLVGIRELYLYLKSNGLYIPKDGNNVSIEEYLKLFANYNIRFSPIAGFPTGYAISDKDSHIFSETPSFSLNSNTPIKNNNDNNVYNYGLGDGSSNYDNSFEEDVTKYARFPKLKNEYDYNNIPQADFSKIFKTKIPDNLPPQNQYSTPRYKSNIINNYVTEKSSNGSNLKYELLKLLFNVLRKPKDDDSSGLFGYTNPLTGNNRIFT